jgi:uncharacterized membrane protein
MKRFIPVFLIFALLVICYTSASAQCAMCQGQVETATDAGSSVAMGVNKGVLYIFMMPYLIIATIGYFWWRARKKAATPAQQS